MSKTVQRPMTAEDKKAWVAALRSGEFEQGRYGLGCADVGFCCLGVANEVLVLGTQSPGYLRDRSGPLFLPLEVQSRLAGLNDVEGLTFLQIASYIEENL